MEPNSDHSVDHGTSSHCHNNHHHHRRDIHGGFRDCSVCLELLHPNPVCCDEDKKKDDSVSDTASSTAMRTTNTTTTTTWIMRQQQQKRKMTFIIPCGHVFHTDCYHRWNQTQYEKNHELQCATCNGPIVASYYVPPLDFNCIVCCQSIHQSQQSVSFTLPDCQLVHTECWMLYQTSYHNINNHNNDGTATTSLRRHQSSSFATTRPSSQQQPIHRWPWWRSVLLKTNPSFGQRHHHKNINHNKDRAILTKTTGSSTKQQYHQSVGVSFQGIPISNIYNVYLFHHNDDNIDSNKVQQEVPDVQKADGTATATISSCCTTTTNYLSMILRDYAQVLAQQQPVVALSVKSTIVNRLLAMFAMDVNDRCQHNMTSIDSAAFVLPTTVEDVVNVLCTIRDCPIRQTTLAAMDGIHMAHAIAQVFEQLKEQQRKCNGAIQNEGSSMENIQGTRQIDNNEPTSASLAIQEQQYATTTTSLYERCCLLLAIVCTTPHTSNCQTAITTGAFQSMLFGVSLSHHHQEVAGGTPTSTITPPTTTIAPDSHDNMSVGLRMALATFIHFSPSDMPYYSMMITTILETMQHHANNTHVQWVGLTFLTQYMQWVQSNSYDWHSRDDAGYRWCRRWLRRHRPSPSSIQPCSSTAHQLTHDNCCALIRKHEGYFREIVNQFPNDLAMTTTVESLFSTMT